MTARAELNRAMAELADGNRAALPEVLALLYPVVGRCCRALVGEADGDDVAQEALLKLMRQVNDYDRERDALSWALTIATFECRTVLRRRGRERARQVSHDGANAEEHFGPTQSGDPEQAAVGAELRTALNVSLADLSQVDRESISALVLEHAQGSQSATQRKRRQRALERLSTSFRRLYGRFGS